MGRPTVMRWQRPAVRRMDEPGSGKYRDCATCGGVATHEYASTPQCEPTEWTVWVPLCFQCREKCGVDVTVGGDLPATPRLVDATPSEEAPHA